MIQFAWPWIGLLAPLPLLLSIATRQRKATSKTAIRLPPDLEFALNTTATKHPHVFRGQMILRWLAWILLLLALAQPWIPGNSTVQPVSGRALALAVDVSASMERRDFSLDGEQSDRLTIVKRVLVTPLGLPYAPYATIRPPTRQSFYCQTAPTTQAQLNQKAQQCLPSLWT